MAYAEPRTSSPGDDALLAAIQRRLEQERRAAAAKRDPLAGLAPVQRVAESAGAAVGGALEAARQVPGVEGGMNVLRTVSDVGIRTPLGAAALAADRLLGTGLTDAARRRLEADRRPIYELPKYASDELGGAFGKIASDPTQDPKARILAAGARGAQGAAEFAMPVLPGVGLVRNAARLTSTGRPLRVVDGQGFRFEPPAKAAPEATPAQAPAAPAAPATGAAPTGRYVVQRIPGAKTAVQVVDTQTGKPMPFAFDDASRADVTAARLNAKVAGAPTAAAPAKPATRAENISTASDLFKRAAGMTDEPIKDTSFGAPGTTFGDVKIGDLVRTIQATTPYKGIRDFGAAVRSGEAAKRGVPQGLIDKFLRGEAEVGLRRRGVSERQIEEILGPSPARAAVPPSVKAPISSAPSAGNTPTPPGGAPPAPPAGAVSPTPASGWDKFLSVWNLPKALKASLDLSAPFRQGILLSAGHPREFFGAFKPMLQAVKSDDFARALDAQIRTVDRPGLYLGPIDDTAGLAAREEAFMSNLANKIPGVSASNRAYVTFLNKLRSDVYDNVLEGWQKGKPVTDADRTGLADVINHFTGRGDLPGGIEGATAALNGAFFSPRYAISRFQSVGDALGVIKSPSSRAAQEAATDLVKFVGAGMTVLTLAQLAGAKVELDPRSSAFGKIQMTPDTSVDIWGGMQPIARYTAQLMTGQSKPIAGARAGEVITAKRIDTLTRYATGKFSPTAGAALGVLRGTNKSAPPGSIGTNFIGQPFSAADLINPVPGASDESLVTPIGWASVVEAVLADRKRGGSGLAGAAVGALDLIGFGVQTIERERPTGTSTSPSLAPTGQPFQFQHYRREPSGPTPAASSRPFRFTTSAGRPSPALALPGGGAGGDVAATVQQVAQQEGIDPRLALAIAKVESSLDPYAVGDGGSSHGLFQENIRGRGHGRAPDYDVARQTARLAADIRRALERGFRGTPGQLAAAVQRPADPAGYARKVDAIYARR